MTVPEKTKRRGPLTVQEKVTAQKNEVNRLCKLVGRKDLSERQRDGAVELP